VRDEREIRRRKILVFPISSYQATFKKEYIYYSYSYRSIKEKTEENVPFQIKINLQTVILTKHKQAKTEQISF